MRYPGVLLAVDAEPLPRLLRMVAAQIKVPVDGWPKYGQRAETRREHLLEIQSLFGFRTFATRHYRPSVLSLNELAWQTDKGIVLATALVDRLRRQAVLLPTANVIERLCAEHTKEDGTDKTDFSLKSVTVTGGGGGGIGITFKLDGATTWLWSDSTTTKKGNTETTVTKGDVLIFDSQVQPTIEPIL